MVADAEYSNDNTITAVARTVKSEGLFSLFSGLSAMVSKQIPYTTVKQVSFDLIAAALYLLLQTKFKISTPTSTMSWMISFSAAFITSILSCLASQPGDMIMTTICQQRNSCNGEQEKKGDVGAIAAIAAIYGKHGIPGFFIGTKARLFHIVTIVTTQLIIYDIIKQAMGLTPTGRQQQQH